MALPSEYVIGDALRTIDDVVVYRAEHPIHGTVDIYMPDTNLPWELSGQVKKRLFQNSRHLRNMSLINMPFVAKALEISQNPNEPYIVMKHEPHDLEEYISNGVMIETKRMFTILLQVFTVMANLTSNGWIVSRLHPRQIKLARASTGDIRFNAIESADQWILTSKNAPAKPEGDNQGAKTETIEPVPIDDDTATADITQDIASDATQDITQDISAEDVTQPIGAASEEEITVSQKHTPQQRAQQTEPATVHNNVYRLGHIAYQLLFGRKYEASDPSAQLNIRKLGSRWRAILERALNQEPEKCYQEYAAVRRDVYRALTRNKRYAVYSIPFWIVLIATAGWFAHAKYQEHKIMTSPAGQAIESFLEIVDQADPELPVLIPPQPASSETKPDDAAILKPFEKIDDVENDL